MEKVKYFQHPDYPEFKIRIQKIEKPGEKYLSLRIEKADGGVIYEVVIPRDKAVIA